MISLEPSATTPLRIPMDSGAAKPTDPQAIAASLSQEFLGAVIVTDAIGTVLAWNAGATALFGHEADDIIGRSILETIVPSELVEEKRRWLATALHAGSAIYESERVKKDGSRIWVDVAVRVHAHDGGALLLVLSERDITPIKYQREARLLETRFRGVLEAAPDATVLTDRTGRIALVNSETEKLFGYGRHELLGQMVEFLMPTRFHKSHSGHRARCFPDPHTRPMGIGLELSGRRKDGSEFPAEISLSPLTIDDVVLTMAAIRDVSGRKRTEEALKAANAELEAFTYSVSHDLRAPIRQIEGFAKVLAEHLGDGLDVQGHQYLQRIKEGSQQMGRLVDDLLTLARVGGPDANPRPVSLGSVVADVIGDLQSETRGRAIEWKVGELPTLPCDPGLMKVVFTNLLSNAVKYTRPRPHALIEIGTGMRDGRMFVFVRDNGVGFDMKYADKLFGVFQRLHRVEEFEGTGVGLATVQRIVRKHGGEIWAEAAPDSGATFSFTLGART